MLSCRGICAASSGCSDPRAAACLSASEFKARLPVPVRSEERSSVRAGVKTESGGEGVGAAGSDMTAEGEIRIFFPIIF